MANLDATIARLRTLPKRDQDALAAQIDLLLDSGEDLLTPEQWADIESRLDSDEALTPHAEVARAFRDNAR